jgi:photosystem II stability/assembly factor-like uncharacterized protein
MVDTSQGWALAPGRVLHTSDGGQTWEAVTPPGATVSEQAASLPNTLTVLDSKVAWLMPGQGTTPLWRTADAGKSWQPLTAPPVSSGMLSFPDPQHGWWLAGTEASMGAQSVDLYNTSDGGASWTLVDRTAPDSPGSLPRVGFKTGITFRDASTGWVGAYTYQPDLVWLYRTNDGGRTWRQQMVTLPDTFKGQTIRTSAPHFFSATEGVLPVTAADTFDTVFFQTRDGGETWTATAPVKARVQAEGRLLADFADPAHGFASDGVMLYTTADGGTTWSTLTPGTSLAGLEQLIFVSDRDGWAVVGHGRGNLLRTTDGGATWTPVPR